MEEIWKPFPLNTNYHISESSKVKCMIPGHKNYGCEVNIQTHSAGYKKVSMIDPTKELYEKGRWTCHYLHRAVAITHIPNPLNLPEVNHLNGDKSNCAVLNIEWSTHKQNVQHTYTHLNRKSKQGEDHHLFGTKASQKTRKLQSEAKTGENHPKFKGWYFFNGNKYPSASIAQAQTGVNQKSIIRYAKGNKKGWAFIPAKTVDNTYVDLEIIPVPKLTPPGQQITACSLAIS